MTARFTVIVIAKMWNSILSLSFMSAAPFRPPRRAASVRRFLAIRGAAKSLFGFHAARGRPPKVSGPLASRRTEGLSSPLPCRSRRRPDARACVTRRDGPARRRKTSACWRFRVGSQRAPAITASGTGGATCPSRTGRSGCIQGRSRERRSCPRLAHTSRTHSR